MATHTKGPWKASGCCFDVAEGEHRVFGSCHFERVPMQEACANARLCAAAPEMLADGKFLLDRLAEFERDGLSGYGEREWIGHVEPAIERFRSAIAKATGNSNPET